MTLKISYSTKLLSFAIIKRSPPSRSLVYTYIERHISCRYKGLWYPCYLSLQTHSFHSFMNENKKIISLCIGGGHGCAVINSYSIDNRIQGQVKCWGLKSNWGLTQEDDDAAAGDEQNEVGESIPFINFGNNVQISQVFCGYRYVCAKLVTNDVKCLGQNDHGQIGIGSDHGFIGNLTGYDGDHLPIVNLGNGFKIADIATGLYHTCTVGMVSGKVKCFGRNQYGQLGLEDVADRGLYPSEMGDSLPFTDLGTRIQVGSIHSSAAAYHSCAILSAPAIVSNRMKCWGLNDKYQLGYGDTYHVGDEPGDMGDNLPLVDLGSESRVKQVALGFWHTCILLFDDQLKCIGDGYFGQLGSGSKRDISATGNLLPSVLIDSGRTIQFLTTGNGHTCIVYDDFRTMKCVGWNNNGQLGRGDMKNRGNSPSTMISNLTAIDLGTDSKKISSIHTGCDTNCVVFESSAMKCFGSNSNGQLLLGLSKNIGDGPYEMGNNLSYSLLFSSLSPSRPPTQNPTSSPTINPHVTIGVGTALPIVVGIFIFMFLSWNYYKNWKIRKEIKDIRSIVESANPWSDSNIIYVYFDGKNDDGKILLNEMQNSTNNKGKEYDIKTKVGLDHRADMENITKSKKIIIVLRNEYFEDAWNCIELYSSFKLNRTICFVLFNKSDFKMRVFDELMLSIKAKIIKRIWKRIQLFENCNKVLDFIIEKIDETTVYLIKDDKIDKSTCVSHVASHIMQNMNMDVVDNTSYESFEVHKFYDFRKYQIPHISLNVADNKPLESMASITEGAVLNL